MPLSLRKTVKSDKLSMLFFMEDYRFFILEAP